MATKVGSLIISLALESGAFKSGLSHTERQLKASTKRMEALGKSMKGLGLTAAAFLGGAVVSQLRSMAREGLEYAGSLGETAQQLGVTTSALQQYRYIATQVGIDQEVMDKGLVKLSGRLGQLALGVQGAQAPFEKLGLSAKDFAAVSQMTAEQALPFLADKFKALASDTERVAAAQDLFGVKMGGKFLSLLAGGGKGVNDLAKAYKDLGIEISASQIAKADKAGDDLSSMEMVVKSKTAQMSADHAAMVVKFETGWAKFKLDTMDATIKVGEVMDKLSAQMDPIAKRNQARVGAMGLVFERVAEWSVNLGESFKKGFGEAIDWTAKLAAGVKLWLQDKLNAVWKRVTDAVALVKNAFWDLANAVVLNSYIPDMVDGIALHMARLDGVMVDPALSATERTKQAFKQLAEDVQGIMGELFPDARNLADFQTKLDKLNQGIKAGGAGGYSAGQLRAGRDRLIDGAGPDVLAGAAIPLADRLRLIGNPADAARDVSAQLDKLSLAANDNAGEVETANVRIAKSFKDMANETVSRLQDLVGAIKGGGFLDILGAVINIGLQLGSVGAFGKGVQTKINAIPAHAAGTSFAPGGVSLVGERGPELVNLPRGSQVIPNHALRGGGGVVHNHFSGNLLTPEWWAQINAGDVRAAQAGALGGQARVAFANSRRLA